MPLDPFRHYDTVQFLKQHEAARMAKPPPEITLGGTFEGLLDIVNPLQHLPVVGTLYRAVSGDKMDAVAKIAGDTLYGGLWGAVGALADTAFEAITGKDFGSTVLALVTDAFDGDKPVAVAQNMAASPPQVPSDEQAFSNALAAKGLDSALSARALYAYRRSQGMADAAAALK
jgi:hypothetical protein